jgi:UDP-3-O-[3-hydroxymyristoyl] N-acetylglucosamine deacetylase
MMHKTLLDSVSLSGVGIHSGIKIQLTVSPGKPETGVRFFRSIENTWHSVPCDAHYAISAARATLLEKEGIRIRTPEHVLSALVGLGITCADITLSDEEVPILDGSAKSFTDAFLSVGFETLSPIDLPTITTPITVQGLNGSTATVLPDTERRFTFLLHFDNPNIGYQYYSFVWTPDGYLNDIAPARTFGFYHEVQALQARGLALGGSLENAVVIGDDGYKNALRFPDELVRHKILDLIGDMALVGTPFTGHVIGVASGHALHAQLAQAIQHQFAT